MDAIYMNESFVMFDSYMERASLQLKVELEEYVESTLTSSSVFVEGAKEFATKMKDAIREIIRRIKTFIEDTKNNYAKYKADKKLEEKIERVAIMLGKHEKFKQLQVKYKDKTPKAVFIKNQKKAFKDLFKKRGTTKDEIKNFFTKYKDQLSIIDKAKCAGVMITVGSICTKGFLSGLIDSIGQALEDSSSSIKDLDNVIDDYNRSKIFKESKEEISKDDVKDDLEQLELLNLYARYAAEMDSDLVKVSKEMMNEMESIVDEALKVVMESIEAEIDND